MSNRLLTSAVFCENKYYGKIQIRYLITHNVSNFTSWFVYRLCKQTALYNRFANFSDHLN